MALALTATLVACDDSTGQNSTINGGGGGGGPEVTTRYYGLDFDRPGSIVYTDFDIQSVTGWVLVQTGDARPVRSNVSFTVTEDMIPDEERDNIYRPFSGAVTVNYTYDGVALTGKLLLELTAPSVQKVTFSVAGTNIRAESGTMTYADFLAAYGSYITVPKNQALAGFVYGDGQRFDAVNDTINITEGLALTPEFSSDLVSVSFDLNAPTDIAWTGATAPADPASQDVAKAGIVSQPQSQNYSSTNYRLVGWSQNPASTGSDLWKFNARVNTQADGNSVTLYGVWALKSYIVSFRLVGGTLAGSLPAGVTAVDPASTSLKEATALVSYNADGKIDSLSLTGINNGTTLAEYYITVALTEDGQQVSFALSDLDSILVKPNYNLTGIFASRADTTEGNAFDAVAVADDRTMYAIWQLDITDYAQYYLDTYIFTLKPDNTYAITGLKANAVEENLIIPDEFQQIAVTEIAAGAFTGNTNITQVDFSKAVNLRKIGDNAFAYCTSLETMSGINALENLVEVGYNAVTGTGWLSAQTGDVVLGQVLVRYGGAQLDGDANLSAAPYKYIARGAFVNASFSSVVLPNDIVGIDDYAFAYMGGLASVTANGTAIEYISSNAFEGTAFVNSATVNLVIGNVFYRAANTERVTVPAGVTVIAEEAFLNCYTVANVVFKNEAAILAVGANAFDGTAYAKNDEDGFLVVNGILAGYYGESETAVVPSGIEAIGAGAFGRDVVNVIFQDWSVKSFADFAFADATALEGIYFIQAASDENWQNIDFADYAFAAESGLALVSNFTLYYTSVTPLGVDGIDPALDFLTSVNTYQTSYAIDDEVVKNVFTDDITTVDAAAVAKLWGSSDGANEDGTFTIANAVLVGYGPDANTPLVTVPSAWKVEISAPSDVVDGTRTVRATIHYTKGTAQGSEYRDVKVFANIELVGIRYADDVLGSADNPLRFFTSQKSFDETGDLVYRYEGIDSATDPVIALGSQNVTVKGYSSSATGGVARDLTVTYNYNGKQFTGTFKYEVVNPTSQAIVQTGSVAIPLGASATNYLSQITFDIVSDDGSTKSANLASSTLSIVGIDGDENKTVITTDVTDVGSHYARITYRMSGDATLTGIAIYSVALVADESVYTVTDGVLTDVRGGREIYVIPDDVTAIGAGAFRNVRTTVTAIYVPDSVTRIDAEAFSGCSRLSAIYGFTVANSSSDSLGVDPSAVVKISSEHRVGTAVIPINGIYSSSVTEPYIVFPEKAVYSGAIALDYSAEDIAKYYAADAAITGDITLTFSMTNEVAASIADRLAAANYGGTVYIPGGTLVENEYVDSIAVYAPLCDALDAKGVHYVLYNASRGTDITALYSVIEYDEFNLENDVVITSRTGDVLINADATLQRFGSEGAYYYYIPESVSILGGEFVVRGVAEGESSSSMFLPDSMVYIPSCFVSLPEGVFDNVTGNVASYVVKADGSAELRRAENNSTIPSTITEIGESAFYGCTSLNVDFSTATSLTAIGAHAFEGCTGLRGVDMGSDKSYALTEIGAYAFATSGVSEIDLSGASNLTDFGNPYTFTNCKDLATVTLNRNTNQIGVGAFMGCTALKQVNGVKDTSFVSMGDGAFYGTSIKALECFDTAIVRKFFSAFNTYTVRFETYGLVKVASIEVVQGDSLTSLPEAVAPEGYAFDGWASDKELTDTVTELPNVADNTVLYAKFSYTISFETGIDGVTVDPKPAYIGSRVELPALPASVADDYTLVGWFSGEEQFLPVDFVDYRGGNITLTAQLSYTISFETGIDGVTIAPVTLDKGSSIQSMPTAPECEGYTFKGWFTADDEDIDLTGYTGGNITVYAIYEYTVTFETGVDGVTVDPVTAKAGKEFPELTAPECEGYTFAGWFTEEGGKGEEVDLASYKGGDITVYAKWEAVEPAPGV